MDDSHPLFSIILFLIIILFDIVFSGMNVALSSVSESDLEKKAEEGNAKAARMLQIIERPAFFLSTVDIVQAAVSILAGVFIVRPHAAALAQMLQSRLQLPFLPSAVISYLLISALVIYLITVVGILFPKRIAVKYGRKWTGTLFGIVSACTAICRPFVMLVNFSVNCLVRLAGINPKDIDTSSEDFIALSLEDKKRLLMEILDKNQLYINYCDMEDESFAVSEEDKAFTKSFYGEV